MAKNKEEKIKLKKRPKRTPLTRYAVKEMIIDNVLWLLGSAMYATAIICFALPNGIAQSGMSGVAIIINHLLDTPIGVTNFVLNIPLIILAWIFIGWKFVSKTLWVTVVLSVMLDVFEKFLPVYRGDALLAAIFCGAISGCGLAFVIMRGATTGGTDIIGKLVRKMFPHMPIGRVILMADAVVVVLAAIVFKNVESALYAAIVMFISSQTIDYIIYGTGHAKMLMVFTNHANEISKAITSNSRRGVSILPVQGGYTGEQKNMLICCVRNSEVTKMNKIIQSVDPENFMMISEAKEVLGKGFKEYTQEP